MGIILYEKVSSSCCRAVKLTLEALNLEYESYILDLANGENYSDYYTKMNPQHTFPTLKDDGFVITDSHAINIYLVTKYGKENSLYPSCVKRRALINQRLFYETGVIFPGEKRIFKMVKTGGKEADPKEIKLIRESYGMMNQFLANTGTKYIAGDQITLADISYIPTLTNLDVLVPGITEEEYPLLASYMKRCKQTMKGYDKINETGHKAFVKIVEDSNYIPPK